MSDDFPPTPRDSRSPPGVRWSIAAALCVLSALNYIDRQALSILAPTIQRELRLSDFDYGLVGQAFLVCYTVAYFFTGRLVDRLGPRAAETLFVAVWSAASACVGGVTGFASLLAARSLLGLAEPGHYAVAAKAVGAWFPPREKGVAVGLYVMGGTLGAAIAAPLVAWLAIEHGWRAAFVVTGLIGLVAAVGWWSLYREPIAHPGLGSAERDWLAAHGLLRPPPSAPRPASLWTLLAWKPLWLILAVRAITDPVWHFYLLWFAKYQQERLGFSLADTGATLWTVFVAADLGCLLAGFLSGELIRRGLSPVAARLRVMRWSAVPLAFSFAIPLAPGSFWPMALACVCAFAVMLFMSSAVTLVVDVFPADSIGSAQGLIGMGGSLSGAITTGLVAWTITHASYDHVFYAMSFLHPLAMLVVAPFLPTLAARLRNAAADDSSPESPESFPA